MYSTTDRMLVNCCLTASQSWRSCWTGCVIAGRLILSVSSGLDLLMMCALMNFPYLFQAFPWLHTWPVIHLLADDYWGSNLDIQRCDGTLSRATLALGSTSLLERLRFPCQVSYSWSCLHFVAYKATGKAILRSSILILHVVFDLLLSLSGHCSYFKLLCSGSESWLHKRRLLDLVLSLNWWRRCRKIVRCLRDGVWLSLVVFDCMPQKLAFTFMSPMIFGWFVGVHSWYGWNVPQKLVQIFSAVWSVCPWFGIETLEDVTPFGPLWHIVLVKLPFGWRFPIFILCTMCAWSWIRKQILCI